MNILIPGIPIGKGRPRAARIGASVRLYTPKDTEAWEKVIAWHARAAMGSAEPFLGPIGLDITFGLPIPESWSKRKKAAACEHMGRPDLDNLVKCVLDGFNGIVFKDDSQVQVLTAAKGYTDEPGVFVLVAANLFMRGDV